MHKNFKNVAIHKSAHEQARFLAKLQDRSIASVVEELIERVFQIAMCYEKEGVNVDFETCVTDSKLIITVTGRSKLTVGSFEVDSRVPNAQVDRMVREKLKVNKK